MSDESTLAAAVAAFESAARSFEAARILLRELVDAETETGSIEAAEDCQHREAFEVSTLGDGPPVWLCPECGEQIE